MAVPSRPLLISNEKQSFDSWQGCRSRLVNLLAKKAERVKATHAFASLGRFCFSTADILSCVTGFALRKLEYARQSNYAFLTAFISGLCCFLVSLLEFQYLYEVDDELVDAIEEDKKWFEALQRALRRNGIMLENSNISIDAPHFNMDTVFEMAAQSIEGRNFREIIQRNMRNMWTWITKKESSFAFDCARVVLQIHTPPKNFTGIFSLNVSDLPENKQNIESVPVFGRLVINSLTASKAHWDMSGDFESKQYRILNKYKEWAQFESRNLEKFVMQEALNPEPID